MSGDSVAEDMLRAGYERWYRLEEEKTAIGEDLKELFAELKGNGFTPKALRESFRRFRNINDADTQEHDAVVDLYLTSLAGAGRAYTRGGASQPRRKHQQFGALRRRNRRVRHHPFRPDGWHRAIGRSSGRRRTADTSGQ